MEWSLVTIHMVFTRLGGFETFVKEETEYLRASKDAVSINGA
jgi:hypothetical protein